MIGGGMEDFRVRCDFPAFRSEGRHLVTVNMFDKPRRCPDGHRAEPAPYNDDALVQKRGERVVAEWKELRLTDGSYLCPVCLSPTLTFSPGGVYWD